MRTYSTARSIAEALRRAFIDFQAIRATYEESRDGTSSHGAPPDPESVDGALVRFSAEAKLTISLYRLGGLADVGLFQHFVSKPEATGDTLRDAEAQAIWSRRFPNALGEHENVELSPDELPPDIAEEMLACVEQWARKQGWVSTRAPESSFGRSAQRETATPPTREASGDGVVPTGGGVSAAPSYLADVRAFVAAADACVAEVERWRQEDGHFVSPGLDRRWRTPFESMHRLYAEKIAPLCQCPLELPKDQGPFDWVREHHADAEVKHSAQA